MLKKISLLIFFRVCKVLQLVSYFEVFLQDCNTKDRLTIAGIQVECIICKVLREWFVELFNESCDGI